MYVQESNRQTPETGDLDVVVCGGGPAGIAAAVTAARAGARVLLIEWHGCFGGIWTAGMLAHIIDSEDKTGVITEVLERLVAQGASVLSVDYDIESMKLVLEEMLVEAGVQLRLHTRVVAALKNEQGYLTHVITESKSGREAWGGRVFIDTTGDGDLSALAGCGFDMGRPGDNAVQPMSLMATVSGLDYDLLDKAGLARHESEEYNETVKVKVREAIQRAGLDPSYGSPTLFMIRHDFFALMTNHEYKVQCDDADAITSATIRARKEVNQVIDGLRSLGSPWEQMRLVATAPQIGIREGRRIHGLYTVTKEDLVSGARFRDAICSTSFCVDIHALDPAGDKGYDDGGYEAKRYDIPLRSLIAKDVMGLMMAGRCISGDFIAHASYRVTGNAVVMGEAAGRAAAEAVQNGCLPHELPLVQNA